VNLFVESPLAELSAEEETALLARQPESPEAVESTVRSILNDVRLRGDAALRHLAREYDGVELERLTVGPETCTAALDRIPTEVRSALERARDNIARFHEAQLASFDTVEVEVEPGVRLQRRTTPLGAVGVYAPGGSAAYPSSVLMGVVPARVAGVSRVIVCSPPGPGGLPSDAVLAAAAIGGADMVAPLGGAGAIGALAYGTHSVPPVDAIVGPGNAWVTEAKRQVAAEHDVEAVVGLVTDAGTLVADVRSALERLVPDAEREDTVRTALARRGFLLLAESMLEARSFANRFAAEHLSVMTASPDDDAATMRTAGTIFLGGASSVAFGDYMTGANHVLPTAGLARTYSGLSVEHMLRSYTVQQVGAAAAARMAEAVAALAVAEGLHSHAAAALARSGS
jgi:histidinol dehydrogenase